MTRFILPIPFALAAVTVAAWLIVPGIVAQHAAEQAVRVSLQIADQIKTIRGYYTANVVGKVTKHGVFAASADHKSNDKAIPLPATFVHDVSALLTKQDITISMYSKYPFPNRADRQLDAFQKEAWDYLSANPQATFTRNDVRSGKQVVRTATADRLTLAGCVSCHNTTAESPKKDWKLGDVRGVMEVTTVIDTQLANGAVLGNKIVVAVLATGVVLLLVILLIARSIIRPIRAVTECFGYLASGQHDVQIPGQHLKNEIGTMARAAEVFKATAQAKDRLESEAMAHAETERAAAEATLRAERAFTEELAKLVEAASTGDFSRRVDLTGKSGLTAKLGEGLNTWADSMSNAFGQVGKVMSAQANGDLTMRMEGNYEGDLLQLKNDVNSMGHEISSIVGRIVEVASAVQGATHEIRLGVTDLSRRTEQQASSLEETAVSLEELSATVRQNAENAQAANQAAAATRDLAAGGGVIAGQAIAAMGKIEESSRQITEIVGLIEEIAFQTNILALNAAVEAARAGDAGRGFAVVANEVRALSQRSSQALKEIKTQIARSDASVKIGADLVKQAGDSLGEIVESVKKVAGLVAEIATASQEQSTGIDQVSWAVGTMDQTTQQNAALVEETNTALQSAQSQIDELQAAVSFFKTSREASTSPYGFAPLPAPAETNSVHRQQDMLARWLTPWHNGSIATAELADWKEF